MNLRLTDKQLTEAILFIVVQNNIALKSLTTAMIEYIADRDGDEAVEKFQKIMNENTIDNKDTVLAGLKIIFGDIDDIDLPDFLKRL
jgi:hypothetical protein